MAQVQGTRSGGRDDEEATTIRAAAVALPLGVVVAVVATLVHPHDAAPMDNRAIFTEYAGSDAWVAIHFAQWAGALLLLGGLVGLYRALRHGPGPVVALARSGLASAGLAAAMITALQAVDGVALKWAVDTWVAAPAGDRTAAFSAARSVRWTEYAFQSYSNILLGLTLVLLGSAMVLGAVYPRWLGAVAAASGVAWVVHGAVVPSVGLFDSTPRLVAMVLLAVWAFGVAPLMWRAGGRRTSGRHQAGAVAGRPARA